MSRSDDELLALAAKAGGIDTSKPWAPLADDGDALRLAVKLGMEISIDNGASMSAANTEHWTGEGYCEGHANNPFEATRRAIVRAAAEIGAGMP
jgi:hypothetical protein